VRLQVFVLFLCADEGKPQPRDGADDEAEPADLAAVSIAGSADDQHR